MNTVLKSCLVEMIAVACLCACAPEPAVQTETPIAVPTAIPTATAVPPTPVFTPVIEEFPVSQEVSAWIRLSNYEDGHLRIEAKTWQSVVPGNLSIVASGRTAICPRGNGGVPHPANQMKEVVPSRPKFQSEVMCKLPHPDVERVNFNIVRSGFNPPDSCTKVDALSTQDVSVFVCEYK